MSRKDGPTTPTPQAHPLDMPPVKHANTAQRSREATRQSIETALRKFKFELFNRGLSRHDFDL